MGKPLSEHDATLQRRKQASTNGSSKRPMEPVHEGGHVRRIVFPGDAEPTPRAERETPIEESAPETLHTKEPAPRAAEPEPRPAEPTRLEPRVPDRQAGRYHPRHRADMDAIHHDIDHRILGRRRGTSTLEATGRSERTVYRTPRGEVRRAEYETSEGRRKALYVRHERGGAPVERRFTGAELERVIRDVPDSTTEAPGAEVAEAPLKEAPAPAGDTTWMGYKGDVHPVVELEGIGRVYMERLNDLGIETTDRLCYEDTATLAKRLAVPEKTVASWKAMAELVKVNGIGPQYAEALARAGIHGIQSLKDKRPEAVAAQVNAYLDSLESTVIKSRPTAKRVETWQKAAKKMRRVRRTPPAS